MTVLIELGPGRTAAPVALPDGSRGGFRVTHPRPDGEPCYPDGYWIPTIPESPVHWDVVSEDPLTLSPSLACRVCGDHGWIRDGKWVPA